MPSRVKNLPRETVTRPRLGWSAGRLLVPSPWQVQDPEWRQQLITLEQPGSVGPMARLGWSMMVQWPGHLATDAFDLTAYGFRIANPDGSSSLGWMAAAGVLVMDLPRDASVKLVSEDYPVEQHESVSLLETAEGLVGLHVQPSAQGLRVVLGSRLVDRDQLLGLLSLWTYEPLEPRWQECQATLADFWAAQNYEQPGADITLARSVDDLLAGLRRPVGELPYFWMLSHTIEGEGQLTDHLYAEVRAWSMIQPAIAAALVKTVLSVQRDDGTIPRIVRPDGFHDTQWLPLPMLARSAWVAWQASPSREFHDFVMPRLQRYLQWAIACFDPEWRGLPVWQDAREAWIAETYDVGVASADLPALMAAELDALRNLAEAIPSGSQPMESLINYRASLGRTLNNYFWNKGSSLFQDRFLGGHPVARITLSATLPLLDTTLPRDTLHPVAEQLDRGGVLRSEHGVRDWAAWPDEPMPPPIREDHQLLILDALLEAGEDDIAQRLQKDLAQRHASESTGGLATDEAALRVVTLGRSIEGNQPMKVVMPLLGWMDRHRAVVVWTTLVPLVLLLLGTIAAFMVKRRMTVQAAETSLGLARRFQVEKRYEEAHSLLREIVDSGRTFPGLYFRLGNTEFRRGRLTEAEAAYRAEISSDPNAVESTLNLALTLLHQQRTEEARALYQSVTNRFHQAAPALAQRAALALSLLDQTPFPAAQQSALSAEQKE